MGFARLDPGLWEMANWNWKTNTSGSNEWDSERIFAVKIGLKVDDLIPNELCCDFR